MKPRKRSLDADGTRLWPIWLAIPAVVLAGLVSAFLVGALLWNGFGRPQLGAVGWDAQTQLDAIRLALFVVGGIGGVVALVVAYRKQRVTELSDNRENSKHFNDRFLAACAELGNDAAAVRLAAVYAIARLADDWRPERQTCIDVLCAYIRLPYESDREHTDWKRGEREVRLSIIRLIRDHLRRTEDDPLSWQGYDFDFTGGTFDGGDFSEATFSGGRVTFSGATFAGGAVHFTRATFSGGLVNFTRATVARGEVNFNGATFSGGEVNFTEAAFSGGEVNFAGATFSGGEVNFTQATFSGGTVRFAFATFSGGEVNFNQAAFSGGEVNFPGATFSGGEVNFTQATFSGGTVHFVFATFSGGVHFTGAVFSGGKVDFNQATFSDGGVDFSVATFSGSGVNFSGATFSGGIVDLSRPSHYSHPPTLDPCDGTDRPGLRLPARSTPTTPAQPTDAKDRPATPSADSHVNADEPSS